MNSAASDDDIPTQHVSRDPFEQSTLVYEQGDHGERSLSAIAHFRIVDLLGRGGQGEVYRADDLKLQRRVALKVLSPAVLALNAESSTLMRARFEREAEVAARLDHPGICPVYEYGIEEGIPWMSMRLIEGEALDRAIKTTQESTEGSPGQVQLAGPIGIESEDTEIIGGEGSAARTRPRDQVRRIVAVIEEAARALHAAHENGLVHRDIKPGNIIVTPAGQAVILDFGLARDESGAGPTLTREGEVMGTPAYMAPEQVEPGRYVLDHRCDVYALGVTLFECLALQRPFNAPTRDALARAILNQDAPDLAKINPAVPRDLAVVAGCALEKDPDRRYASALAFADDLRRVLKREPIAARPLGTLGRIARWAQRNPAVATLLGIVGFLLVSAVILGQAQNRRLVDANSELTDARQEALAAAESARAEAAARSAALAEYERMADIRRLADARREAAALWPAHPDLVVKIRAWEERYAPLADRLPEHRRALDALRARALPYSEADRARDHAEAIATAARLKKALPAMKLAYRPDVEKRIAKLETETKKRASWDLGEDMQAQFRHDALAGLVTDLERFSTPETGLLADLRKRLETSQRIGPATLTEPAAAWTAAAVRVAKDARFPDLKLSPQVGLIPLGADPVSGLEEFLHWQSHEGDLPTRTADGRFSISADTGLIFVLVPGGTFAMGTQSEQPTAPGYDALARGIDGPVHDLTIDPYFLSKYEITQAQWKRLTGESPSAYFAGYKIKYQEGTISETHPVEQVSWLDGERFLPRWGLVLPTEARWERAARANTDTVYVGTSDPKEVSRFGNLPGEEGRGVLGNAMTGFRDDWLTHAPVGLHEPNAFGFFDIMGNVWEWCRDPFGSFQVEADPGDGLRASTTDNRSYRGGSYSNGLRDLRIGLRTETNPDLRFSALGIRPARDLQGL